MKFYPISSLVWQQPLFPSEPASSSIICLVMNDWRQRLETLLGSSLPVSMVKMALQKLSDEDVVELDDDKKAAMVSNLLVVLCGDDTAQPVVNTGTLNH